MEQRGIPSLSFCTDQFAPLAQAHTRGLGLPGLPIVVVPHPNATRTPEELDRVAAQVVEQVLDGLTKPAKDLETEYGNKKYKLPKRSISGVE